MSTGICWRKTSGEFGRRYECCSQCVCLEKLVSVVANESTGSWHQGEKPAEENDSQLNVRRDSHTLLSGPTGLTHIVPSLQGFMVNTYQHLQRKPSCVWLQQTEIPPVFHSKCCGEIEALDCIFAKLDTYM